VLRRPGADRQPFVRFIGALFSAYEHRAVRAVAGPALERLVGLEPDLLRQLYTEHELRSAAGKTMDELAAEALAERQAA
jgi:hypothetical protein